MSATHFRSNGQARLIRGCFSSSQCFRAGVFSSLSPPPYPALFDSLHFLPSFRVSICAFASETFARPKKTPALQANKIQHSFDLGRYATLCAMGLKLCTRSSRNIKAPRYRRRLFSINFLQIFYQTIKFEIECAIKIEKPSGQTL